MTGEAPSAKCIGYDTPDIVLFVIVGLAPLSQLMNTPLSVQPVMEPVAGLNSMDEGSPAASTNVTPLA